MACPSGTHTDPAMGVAAMGEAAMGVTGAMDVGVGITVRGKK